MSNSPEPADVFSRGLLRPELFIGVASAISALAVDVNLSSAGRSSGSHFHGQRYGCGEVGEFVLIAGQMSLLLGRIRSVGLRESARRTLTSEYAGADDLDAIGQIQLLGCVAMGDLRVTAGVDSYPRLGDRIYSAPHHFIARLPQLMEDQTRTSPTVAIALGAVAGTTETTISITPERLFGRHCAILGATGGGKSWTMARIIEQCLEYNSRLILIDPTGEYRGLSHEKAVHCHLGTPLEKAPGSLACSLPPNTFEESDFIALFQPAGKVQGPRLREAIRSLRLASLAPELADNGIIRKADQSKLPYEQATQDLTSALDDPRTPFDPFCLVAQIEEECVYPSGFAKTGARGQRDPTKWGGRDDTFSHCMSLIARINGALTSPALSSVFSDTSAQDVVSLIDTFSSGSDRLLRICLSGIAYEYNAREVMANAIGRHLLNEARRSRFRESPTVVLIDEAHNFLGRRLGADETARDLDAFELIAREGRKYGLNIGLATQRPRDITENVLSQMGTLIVHRLTNEHDQSVVARACGEIDRSSVAHLPNLQPGEAVLIGTDFPVPVTVRVSEPLSTPFSAGPPYQRRWAESS